MVILSVSGMRSTLTGRMSLCALLTVITGTTISLERGARGRIECQRRVGECGGWTLGSDVKIAH